ncbi:MAG: HAD-IIIA family hydrolase [Actinobacteria bacterium]|nr:HAD-IIIA family hydrolase [Actinomycetota bacterium]
MKKAFAVFIDRDGTINQNFENLYKSADLHLLSNSAQAILLLNQAKIPAIVITNQPVVARGLIDEKGVEKIHQEINNRIGKIGARIDSFYFCPHHPQANLEQYRVTCICRKPGIEMYKQAAQDFKVNLNISYVIGDTYKDINAGNALGATTIAVLSGQSDFQNSKPDYTVKDLLKAVKLILKRERLWKQ